jgi:hypothetical protein
VGAFATWLDDFMEGVLLNNIAFDINAERNVFTQLFEEIQAKLGESAFVKFRGSTAGLDRSGIRSNGSR